MNKGSNNNRGMVKKLLLVLLGISIVLLIGLLINGGYFKGKEEGQPEEEHTQHQDGEETDLGQSLNEQDTWEVTKSDSLTIPNFGKKEDLINNYLDRIDGEDNYGNINKLEVDGGIITVNGEDRLTLDTNKEGYVVKVTLEQKVTDEIENENKELVRYNVVYGLLWDSSTSVKTYIGKLVNKHNFNEEGLKEEHDLSPYKITQTNSNGYTILQVEYVGD